MTWDYKKEIGRKGIHLFSISFVFIYLLFAILFNNTKAGLLVLAIILVVMIEFEYIRIELKKKVVFLSWLWSFKREKEKETLGGEVFFLIGSIICLAIFDIRVAVAAIFMTTFGDLAAALIGKRFGKTWLKKNKNKAWEGVIAEFIVNIIVGFLILRTIPSGIIWWLGSTGFGMPIWPVIIAMALTATIVETMIQKLDDNLLIPLFAGTVGQVTLLILQAFF